MTFCAFPCPPPPSPALSHPFLLSFLSLCVCRRTTNRTNAKAAKSTPKRKAKATKVCGSSLFSIRFGICVNEAFGLTHSFQAELGHLLYTIWHILHLIHVVRLCRDSVFPAWNITVVNAFRRCVGQSVECVL